MNHNHLDDLPKIIVFNNLHVSESLRSVIKTLTGIAGIYAIINTVTGRLYIGSSVSVGIRLTSHLIRRNTNGHLQSAIALIGLEVFQVVLVEIYELDPNLSDVENIVALLEREQPWLDWLFSLPPPAHCARVFSNSPLLGVIGPTHCAWVFSDITNKLNF